MSAKGKPSKKRSTRKMQLEDLDAGGKDVKGGFGSILHTMGNVISAPFKAVGAASPTPPPPPPPPPPA